MSELLLMLRGVLALVAPERLADELAAADQELELKRNSGLRNSTAAQQHSRLSQGRSLVVQRLRLLRHALGSSLLLVATALAAGLVLHVVLRPDGRDSRYLSVASLFLFAWATLGRLGWTGQSYGGDTSVERLDQWLFFLLYWLAMLAGTVALA